MLLARRGTLDDRSAAPLWRPHLRLGGGHAARHLSRRGLAERVPDTVAVLFLLEIDEMLYAHGTSGAFRLSSEEHARPAVGPDDERAMVWSKSAIVLAVSAGTPLGVVAYPELGFTTFVLQGFVTMLPPMLAEVGALLWGRGSRAAALRMGDLTLQLVVGVALTLLLNPLALQFRTS